MSLVPGTRFGPYEIQSALGAGGMGEVYKARDTRLDRIVAIKILPEGLAADPQFRDRFDREARTISQLDHPHVCALYDVGDQNGTAYLVMQYLEGETLADRLTKGALPLDQALQYAVHIADALDRAHRAGIIHRDLKPGNIMLTKAGATLLDFGLAKSSAPVVAAGGVSMSPTTLQNLTAQGTILGTFQYMAPEQLEGRDADTRTDIFAFGAVFYEMVTGRRAFEGATPASVIGAILKDEPPPISAAQPGIPPALDRVVRTCLAKDPDERWQSTADLKRELRWIADSRGRTGAASDAGPGTRQASRMGWWMAGVASALLVVTLPFAWRQWRTAPAEAEVIRFPLLAADKTTFAATAATVPTLQLAVSPDGRRVVFVATPAGGGSSLWIRSLDASEPQMLGGTEDAAYPFWSPDSQFIGFFAQGKIKKIDLTGGTPRSLCDCVNDPRGGTWNRDGVILFPQNTASGLSRVSANGGPVSPVLTLQPGEASHRWPSFLPDGRHFLFYVRGAERRGVYVGSLDSKATTRVFDSDFNAVFAPPAYLLTVRDGVLLAYPFDLTNLRIVGEADQVAEHVGGSSTSLAPFSVSNNGVLVYGRPLTIPSQLTWFDRNGKSLGPATDVGDYPSFRLSPDGKRVALARVDPVTNTTDIWMLDLARGVPTRFTSDPGTDASPIWSPDGTRILFRSERAGGNFPFEKAASGGQPETLMASIEAPFPTDWSPDGKFIVYHANTHSAMNSYDVMLLQQPGGTKPIPVAQTGFTEIGGHFSPDGRWIAYASDESGQMEIYVQALPQSGGKIRVSTGGGLEPLWSRDGKELFYLALDHKLMAVPVSGGSTFESGAPHALFETRTPSTTLGYRTSYDVAADGQRFLVTTPLRAGASSSATVVLNWTAALKK